MLLFPKVSHLQRTCSSGTASCGVCVHWPRLKQHFNSVLTDCLTGIVLSLSLTISSLLSRAFLQNVIQDFFSFKSNSLMPNFKKVTNKTVF